MVHTFSTSAPARRISRALRRIGSTPSTTLAGIPGWCSRNGTSAPQGIQSSACPPVWLMIVIAICIRGPATRPSCTALRSPASEPPASRTVVTPVRSVAPRFRAAS